MTEKEYTLKNAEYEIAEKCVVRREVVHLVLKEFAEILKREIVRQGKFSFLSVFKIHTVPIKARKVYNVGTRTWEQLPETKKLVIKLAPKINVMFRQKRRQEKEYLKKLHTNGDILV